MNCPRVISTGTAHPHKLNVTNLPHPTKLMEAASTTSICHSGWGKWASQMERVSSIGSLRLGCKTTTSEQQTCLHNVFSSAETESRCICTPLVTVQWLLAPALTQDSPSVGLIANAVNQESTRSATELSKSAASSCFAAVVVKHESKILNHWDSSLLRCQSIFFSTACLQSRRLQIHCGGCFGPCHLVGADIQQIL